MLTLPYSNPIEFERAYLGKHVRQSSPAWCAITKSTYGAALTDEELSIFRQITGLESTPVGGAFEICINKGRRGGGSEWAGRTALYEGLCVPHADAGAPGQRLIIPVICPLRIQAKETLRYVEGLCKLPPRTQVR